MLWAEGMSKDERDTIAGQLKKLTIALPFEEKAVRKEDKEEIEERLGKVKISMSEMVDRLKSKGSHIFHSKISISEPGWRERLWRTLS